MINIRESSKRKSAIVSAERTKACLENETIPWFSRAAYLTPVKLDDKKYVAACKKQQEACRDGYIHENSGYHYDHDYIGHN